MNPELEKLAELLHSIYADTRFSEDRKDDPIRTALTEAYELGRKEAKEETKKKVLDWFCNVKFEAKD